MNSQVTGHGLNFISQEEADFSRREKQLQDEINNLKQKVENLKKENNVCEIFLNHSNIIFWNAEYIGYWYHFF